MAKKQQQQKPVRAADIPRDMIKGCDRRVFLSTARRHKVTFAALLRGADRAGQWVQ